MSLCVSVCVQLCLFSLESPSTMHTLLFQIRSLAEIEARLVNPWDSPTHMLWLQMCATATQLLCTRWESKLRSPMLAEQALHPLSHLPSHRYIRKTNKKTPHSLYSPFNWNSCVYHNYDHHLRIYVWDLQVAYKTNCRSRTKVVHACSPSYCGGRGKRIFAWAMLTGYPASKW